MQGRDRGTGITAWGWGWAGGLQNAAPCEEILNLGGITKLIISDIFYDNDKCKCSTDSRIWKTDKKKIDDIELIWNVNFQNNQSYKTVTHMKYLIGIYVLYYLTSNSLLHNCISSCKKTKHMYIEYIHQRAVQTGKQVYMPYKP